MTPDEWPHRPAGLSADVLPGRVDVLPAGDAHADGPTRAHAERLGAHRPRRAPLLDLLPLLVVVMLVAAVGVGVWQLASATPSTVTASGGSAERAADAAPTPSAPRTATTRGAPTATATGTPPSTPTASGPVDRGLPVTVLNATGRAGLAGRAATTLRSSGWTVLTGNSGERPTTTVVYYPRQDLAASAQAVAAGLTTAARVGSPPSTELTQRFGTDRITVVLGADASAS